MPSPTSLPTTVAAGDTGHVTHTNTVHTAVNALSVVPVSSVTSSRDLGLADCGELLQCSSSSAIVLTIPANATVAFPIGAVISVARWGTGSVTVTAASGVTLRNAALAATLRVQYSVGTLQKVGTNEWSLSGDLG